jgi:hypothetical protein
MMKWTVVRMLGFALTSLGLTGAQAIAQSTLVSTGAVWRYLDTGVDQGMAWRALAFDDSAWGSGLGELGFGDGDEATILSRTNALGETNITCYFRHLFNVPDISAYSNLLVRLRRDDGAVVYLNGVEVFRSNMPTGVVDYATPAFLAQDDGAGIFARPINRSLLLSGDNLLAVEVHQNTNTSSDISFDLELAANVTFEPPVVNITSPSDGAVIGSPTVVLTVGVSDVDGVVTMVEFFESGNLLGIATEPPFTFVHSGLAPGTHRFTAVAIDSTGVNATSAPVAITVVPWIVPSHAAWKYLDDGSEPGSAWSAPGFDDSGWSNGVAQLGFGEGDETTPIRRFSDLTGTNVIAYYFRHAFTVADPSTIARLSVRLLRDDGAVVYLNGVDIFRSSMPTGAVDSMTFASLVAEDNLVRSVQVNPRLLVPGGNVIAVEVHQANLTSSDVSFDLELLPNLPQRPPAITLTSPADNAGLFGPTNVTLTAVAADVDDAVESVGFHLDGRLAASVAAEPYSVVLSNLLGNHTLFAVATDSSGLSSTSAPVNLGIARVTTLVSTGAVWKFLDTGVPQGTNWRAAGFDDSAWPSGPAKLGTNDAPATVIRIRGTGGIIPTCYFRHTFVAADLSRLTNLAFRVLRDDGCIAYLNGTEIFRMNMPTGEVVFNTYVPSLQAVGGSDESTYYPTNISPALLVNGNNVLAVELHQTSNTSDAGFDLGLTGIAIPPVTVPPLTIEHTMTGVVISWPGSGFVLQESSKPDGPYANRPGIASPHHIAAPTGNRFFRLSRP